VHTPKNSKAPNNFAISFLKAAALSQCLRCTIGSKIINQELSVYSHTHTHTHTYPFNGPFSGTTRVSQYQKCETNLDFTEARDSEWQWHQLDHMQVCISLQTDNHASTPPLKFFTGRMPFLPPKQQCQSTEGILSVYSVIKKYALHQSLARSK